MFLESQVSWELRLLAKNHGVKICMGITEAKESVLFQTQKRMLHPVLWYNTVHIFSYNRRISATLNCSRDINGLTRNISLHPQLCCCLHVQIMAPFCQAVTTY